MTLANEFQLSVAQAQAALGALRAVVAADGPPRAGGARFLAAAAETLGLGDGQGVPSADPKRLGEHFVTAAAKRTLAHALVIAACCEGEVTLKGEATVGSLVKALDVQSHWVELLPALRRRNAFTVKRQLFRRSPDARRLFARIWAEEGLRGFGRVLLFVLGLYRDPKLAARFRELGALPKGTVGRTYFDDFQARKLAFPGERGGMPERMVHHDFMHVINRYGTDAAGECELAGFYAGFTPGDSFTFIMIVLATFQLGMPVSPAAVTPARLAFDPARVVAAFLRGRRLRVDVMGQWNYWELVPLSIDEAQARLGLAEVTRGS